MKPCCPNSVFSYKGIKGNTKWELFNADIVTVEEIPDNYPLNNTEQLVVSSIKNQSSYIHKNAIRSFIDGLKYPLYFLDFETLFMVSVPIYNNSRPFQQIPPLWCKFVTCSHLTTKRIPIFESVRPIDEKHNLLVYYKSHEHWYDEVEIKISQDSTIKLFLDNENKIEI